MYAELIARAHAAGVVASLAAQPTPMVVYHAGIDGQQLPNTPTYYESEGVCGFGWVEVRPRRGPFVKWARANGVGRDDRYSKCHRIRSPLATQSYTRNVAYAEAYAEVLREAGINATGTGRLD